MKYTDLGSSESHQNIYVSKSELKIFISIYVYNTIHIYMILVIMFT